MTRLVTVNPKFWYNPDTYNAYNYANFIIKKRCYEAEHYIMKNPYHAYRYATDVIKDRWPEAEPIIKISGWKNYYQKWFKCKI